MVTRGWPRNDESIGEPLRSPFRDCAGIEVTCARAREKDFSEVFLVLRAFVTLLTLANTQLCHTNITYIYKRIENLQLIDIHDVDIFYLHTCVYKFRSIFLFFILLGILESLPLESITNRAVFCVQFSRFVCYVR